MSKLLENNVEIPTKIQKKFLNGYCAYRSILAESETLEIQYGMLWVKDSGMFSGMKGFDSPFPWHFWVIDNNDNVYDNFSDIMEAIQFNRFDCKHPSKWKIKLVDGSTFNCKQNPTKQCDDYRKNFDKWYKDYDAVYIYNFAFEPSAFGRVENGVTMVGYDKQMSWDDAEIILQNAEKNLNK
jgi:hypothetical protein